jgi:hypothetical protein
MTTTSSQRPQAEPGSGDPPHAAAVPAIDGTADDPVGSENTHVDLGRLAWLATVLACLIAVFVLVLEGYYGYAGVTFAVAMSAGINLT